MNTQRSTGRSSSALPASLQDVFGDPGDPLVDVERRARQAFPGQRVIVWEGDAQTFQFLYVGADAQALLGYPPQAWTSSPSFWVDQVVHPDDRRDAVAYCALATGRRADHVFEYRARHADGTQVWLLDYVAVVLGERGLPVRLRGLMLDITDQKLQDGTHAQPPALQRPAPHELLAL